MKTKTFQFLEPREALDMKTLLAGVRKDATDLAPWLTKMSRNQQTRDCIWAGQSDDGRVHKKALGGKQPFPWENASDARLPVADEVINECKLTMTSARRAAKLEVKGHNSGQDEAAAKIIPVLRYVLGTQMRSESITQPELMADYALEHGVGFMHVGWLQTREIEERTMTVDDLLSLALQVQPPLPEGEMLTEELAALIQAEEEARLWELLIDPERKNQLIEALKQFDPAMTDAEARRVAVSLRKGEPAVYYRPYVRESRAFWEALCLGVDITLPPAALLDIQRAPRVTRWHWLTEAMLHDRAQAEGWDAYALEKVAQHPGAMWSDWGQQNVPQWVLGMMGVGQTWQHQDAVNAKLYHIAETWQRFPTKAGPSVLYRTVHHACCPEKPLLHEVVKDAHGRIPIVVMRAETRGKLLLQSRGVAERCMSWQTSLKLHHDARDNNTMLRTLPPFEQPMTRFGGAGGGVGGERGESLPVSPFSAIHVRGSRASGESLFSFVEVPGQPVDSERIANDLRVQLRRYFGLADPSVPGPVTQMHQQGLVGRFLEALNEAMDLTLQLCQQYMDPIAGARIAGMAVPLNASREDIQGEWLMDLSYDVRELDLDYLQKKFDLLAKMLAFDSGGNVKRVELMRYVFSAADPVLAERLIMDDSGAQDAAYQDEKTVITTQLSNQRVTGRLDNPQSRLMAHQEWVEDEDSMNILRSSQKVAMLEILRVEALEHNLEQATTNKQTGMTGEKPLPWQDDDKLSVRLRIELGVDPPRGAQSAQMAQGMPAEMAV